jgi:type II secretory pathway component PulF
LPIFSYQAAQGTERVTGQVEAGDRRPAVGQLCKMDLVLLMVTESEEKSH